MFNCFFEVNLRDTGCETVWKNPVEYLPVCHHRKRRVCNTEAEHALLPVSQNNPKCLQSRAFILKSIDRIDFNLCLFESVGILKAIYVHFSPIKGYFNSEIICTKNVHDTLENRKSR